MRKRAYTAGALGLSLALAMSGVSYGQNGTQTVDGEIQGTKNASLRLGVEYIPGSDGLLAHATNAAIDLPSEVKITTAAKAKKKKKKSGGAVVSAKKKKIATCDPATLEGTTTDQAIAACGKAQIGQGSAIADVVGTDLPVTVTAFNGTPSGGSKTVLLHSRVDAASLTTLLVGTFSTSPAGGVYGQRVNIAVPPLAGGAAAIQQFQVTLQKKIVKGVGYITAKCGDGTYSFQATFDYSDAPQQVATDTQAC